MFRKALSKLHLPKYAGISTYAKKQHAHCMHCGRHIPKHHKHHRKHGVCHRCMKGY